MFDDLYKRLAIAENKVWYLHTLKVILWLKRGSCLEDKSVYDKLIANVVSAYKNYRPPETDILSRHSGLETNNRKQLPLARRKTVEDSGGKPLPITMDELRGICDRDENI